MFKKLFLFTVVLCCCVGGTVLSKTNLLDTKNLRIESTNNYDLATSNILNVDSIDIRPAIDSNQYYKYINVSATEQMPDLSFKLTGKIKHSDYYTNFYYPLKLVIKTNDVIIQEIDFNEDDFAPCTLDDFGFEYGDFKFDGYGSFKILSTSMGKNASYYFWTWDKDKNCFVEYPDLEIIGYMTFDYNNQVINISNTGSATYHELTTYKYINNKLTLIKKVIDADYDGYRKIYELKNGDLELIEITESQLK